MKNSTREKYDAWCLLQASQNKLNSSKLDGISFSLTPSASQTIVDKMQESADLLKQINILEVDEQEEESIGLTSVPLSSTNNSTTEARHPVQGCTAETDRYRCEQVNTDTYVSYEKLDQWAGLDNFFGHMESQIYRRQALDVILTGIYGTHHAAKSDITANPLLQDVNTGWLEKWRRNASARVVNGVSVSRRNNANIIESSGDYGTIDSLTMEAYQELLDPWHTGDSDLVVICNLSLITGKYYPFVNNLGVTPNKELLAFALQNENRQIGGLPVCPIPFFPQNAMLVTSLDNLSLYWQTGTHRRKISEEPEFNRVSTYDSWNNAYVVEDYGKGCLIEGIIWGNDQR